MPWDPSIITNFKQYTGPDPDQTARTLSQMALQGVRQQHTQASLASLLDQQNQERAIRGVYMANAKTPENIPQALMGVGAGQEAATANKSYQETLNAQFEHSARALSGVTDDAGLAAAKQAMIQGGIPAQYVAQIPDSYAEAKPKIDAFVKFAIPAEKQAEMTNRLEAAKLVAGANVVPVTDEHGNQFFAPKAGGAARPIVDANGNQLKKPPRPAGGGGAGTGGAAGGLTPEAVDSAANRYNETGEMIPAGQGKGGIAIRTAVLNRAAELAAGGSIGGNKADYKANSTSLRKLQTTADNMQSFEDTALKNLDTALSAASKIPDAGGALLNKPIRAWADMMGNTDMAAYKAALITARTEIGKVLSGAMGNGGLSEGAREEVGHLMGENATLAQLQSAAAILKKDMANRKEAVEGQMATIRARMRGGKKTESTAAAPDAGGGEKTGGGKQPPNGHTTIVQNGHTFTWNPDSGEYE